MHFIGVDIGGTKSAVVVATGQASVVGRTEFPTEPTRGPDVVVERIARETEALLSRHQLSQSEIEGVGISCGGPLESARGILLSPPNLTGWSNVPIVDMIGSSLNKPAWLQNDANACALAEWHFGAGRGSHDMIFLTFGTGLGAGLILNDRLYCGSLDLAGEVGHIRIADDGPVGYGKIGSAEGLCSGGGIAQLAHQELLRRHQLGESPQLAPRLVDIGKVTARDIGDAAENGDALALQVLEKSGRALGKVLSILVDLLNPELVVIGSVYARLERFLGPPALETLAAEALPLAVQNCRVAPAGLGERVGDIAAVSVAIEGATGTLSPRIRQTGAQQREG